MERRIACIKIGGTSVTNGATLGLLLQELSELRSKYRFVIIHGGGSEVSRLSRRLGIEPVFNNGVRVTSDEEMDIVDMVLCGKMNKYLVRKLYANGVESIGLSGSDGRLCTGEAIGTHTRTGRVVAVNGDLIRLVVDGGWIPVIASTSMDSSGQPLNINADEVALAVATELPAPLLIFISDIRGILKNEKVIKEMKPDEALNEIENGVITGGMIPKVTSSIQALKEGVQSVIIGGFEKPGELEALIDGSLGTRIYREE